MNTQTNHCPSSALTISMLLSETVYRAVVNIERMYRHTQRLEGLSPNKINT